MNTDYKHISSKNIKWEPESASQLHQELGVVLEPETLRFIVKVAEILKIFINGRNR